METREEHLKRAVEAWEQLTEDRVNLYLNKYYSLDRESVLPNIAPLSVDRGLECIFIEGELRGMKQNFYVACKLFVASQQEAKPSGDVFADYAPFLYGLLSDSPEIYDWLAHVELKDKDYVKGAHFLFHQFQLAMQRDDEALREAIALVAKKGGNRDKALAQAGQDFFSLLLKQDKVGLQAMIEGQAKIKSAHELEGQFLAGFAVIHAKLCWYRGIEVQIQNPLVPMPLMPIQPLDAYDVEYDFLRPGWMPPPPPGLLAKVKRLFS
ncbi:hypothetical protein G8A07_11475 [Roseateles sp. DAIF2]|uniref:hypothetical protein n=1 Tax=Roseateles sp. DAIF2 TaxID=2714952 RepID=UPI0018A31891|nr:hypothetical protein [Roseateles sp. DAIF2]QPF73477.1 hypothetical protein G8A07_11475 [Roseateles sp. DAIF2]